MPALHVHLSRLILNYSIKLFARGPQPSWPVPSEVLQCSPILLEFGLLFGVSRPLACSLFLKVCLPLSHILRKKQQPITWFLHCIPEGLDKHENNSSTASNLTALTKTSTRRMKAKALVSYDSPRSRRRALLCRRASLVLLFCRRALWTKTDNTELEHQKYSQLNQANLLSLILCLCFCLCTFGDLTFLSRINLSV